MKIGILLHPMAFFYSIRSFIIQYRTRIETSTTFIHPSGYTHIVQTQMYRDLQDSLCLKEKLWIGQSRSACLCYVRKLGQEKKKDPTIWDVELAKRTHSMPMLHLPINSFKSKYTFGVFNSLGLIYTKISEHTYLTRCLLLISTFLIKITKTSTMCPQGIHREYLVIE